MAARSFIKYIPHLVFLLTLPIYLASLISTSLQIQNDKGVYGDLCQAYWLNDGAGKPKRLFQSCWPFFYQAWAIAIAFSSFGIVAVLALFVLHSRAKGRYTHAFTNAITISLFVFFTAGWLAVVVLGWIPPKINLEQGRNRIPKASSSGNAWSSQVISYDAEPHTGIFHYALAWYYATVGLGRPVAKALSDHGNAAMAAVVTCNFSFAWSVIATLILSITACLNKPVIQPDGPITKERGNSVETA